MNSVINGKEDSIQIQVQDVNKCFDKLWLQETTNALNETGLTNNNLNLLYLENKKAKVAIKINNRLTKKIPCVRCGTAGISLGKFEMHHIYGQVE